VVFSGKALQVTKQTKPCAKGHLLHRPEIQHCSQTVKPKLGCVSQKKSQGDKRQQAHAAVGNNVIDQQSHYQWIDKAENPSKNDAEITPDVQAKERSDPRGDPCEFTGVV
jgi:hypothetical protein